MKGHKPLDEALAQVKQERQFQQSDEAKLTRLQQDAPDLAERVNEERLKIDEALTLLTARQQELRRVCEDARRAAQDILGQFCGSAAAIIQGIDNGEPIVIPPKQIEQFHQFIALLLERIPALAGPMHKTR